MKISLQKPKYKKCRYCFIQKNINSFLKNKAKCKECRCSRFSRKCACCLQVKDISFFKKKKVYRNDYIFLVYLNRKNTLIKVNSICKGCHKDRIKTCSKCKITKSLENFSLSVRDGHNQKCQTCSSKRKVSLVKDTPNHKICTGCKLNLHFSMYSKESKNNNGLKSKCRKCASGDAKIWRQTERYKLKKRISSGNRRAILAKIENNMPDNWWQILLNFYGELCMFPNCTKDITKNNPLTHDHVIPLSWPESSHSLENSQILCMSHNTGKLNRSADDYRNGNICSLANL